MEGTEGLRGKEKPRMPAYECCLLDCCNEIVEMELIHCAYDRDARHSADDLLVHRPEFHGVEVWHQGRRIYVNLVGVEADG
jgi:hypothetical protein